MPVLGSIPGHPGLAMGDCDMSGGPPPPLSPEAIQAREAIRGNRTSHLALGESVKGNRIQRWALGASVLFSLLALVVSVVGLILQNGINNDQRAINADQRRAIDDQIATNNEQRVDEAMEYAIRVSWWQNASGDVVTIQNRSTVPISGVTFRYRAMGPADTSTPYEDLPLHGGTPVAFLEVIPPCTSLAVDMEEIRNRWVGEPPDYGVYGFVNIAFVRVDFIDVHGSWSVGPSGEEPQTLAEDERIETWGEGSYPLPADLLLEEQPASDCGSG